MKKHYFIVPMLAALAAVPAMGQVRAASEPVKLIDANVGLMAPVWSPDGSRIAVTTDNYKGILVANADGSNLRVVTSEPGAGYKMAWSADSRTIAARVKIERVNGNLNEMRAYNLDGTSVVTVPARRTAAEPISLTATGLYAAMTANPAGVAAATPALERFAGKTVINPALSPDGSKVAFQIPGQGMWVINSDGSDLRQLGRGSHPAWMPDSRTIVYTIVTDNGESFTGSTLMSMDIETAATNVVFSSSAMVPMTPAVSPDGTSVLFENAADAAIYVLTLKK